MDKPNRGSATVEACVVIPLFLFVMLFVIYIYRMIYADAHIHQCLAEAAVYCAKQCYQEERLMTTSSGDDSLSGNERGEGVFQSGYERGSDSAATGYKQGDVGAQAEKGLIDSRGLVNTGIIYTQFRKYLEDDRYVEQVVAGGKNGIIITVHTDEENGKIFTARAAYYIELRLPIFGSFRVFMSDEVKEKAFLGYSPEEAGDDADTYVYITPNEAVYHVSRSCTHLTISVRERNGHGNYEPCSFCGKEATDSKVYVTDNGSVYHNNIHCLGLKRTVMRVKKSDVAALKVCSRCGR